MSRRLLLTILIIIIFIAASTPMMGQHNGQCSLIVIAKVEKIGENPGMISGGVAAVYRLATYSIIDILKGRLDKTEIIGAHVMLTGNELDELRVGY